MSDPKTQLHTANILHKSSMALLYSFIIGDTGQSTVRGITSHRGTVEREQGYASQISCVVTESA